MARLATWDCTIHPQDLPRMGCFTMNLNFQLHLLRAEVIISPTGPLESRANPYSAFNTRGLRLWPQPSPFFSYRNDKLDGYTGTPFSFRIRTPSRSALIPALSSAPKTVVPSGNDILSFNGRLNPLPRLYGIHVASEINGRSRQLSR